MVILLVFTDYVLLCTFFDKTGVHSLLHHGELSPGRGPDPDLGPGLGLDLGQGLSLGQDLDPGQGQELGLSPEAEAGWFQNFMHTFLNA